MKRYLSCLVILFLSAQAFSQAGISNPYSRFGIGIIEPSGSVNHFGMGGITSTSIDPNTLNIFNPASYANLSRTTLQISGRGGFQTVSNESSSERFSSGQPTEITFGLKKQGSKWGFAFGLVPYSTVGYNLTSPYTLNDSTSVNYKYDGIGGINRFVFGVGRSIKLYKDPVVSPDLIGTAKSTAEQNAKDMRDSLAIVRPRLNVGANFNYLFGTLRQESRVEYGSTRFYSTRITSRTTINDVTFDVGAHYFMPIRLVWEGRRVRRGTYLNIGANYMLGNDMNTRFEELGEMYLTSAGRESVIDTTFQTPEMSGVIRIPMRLTAGASLLFAGQEGRSTTVALEYRTQDWSTFSSTFEDAVVSSALTSFNTIALGFERTPRNTEAASNIFERSTYRLGIRTTQVNITLRDQTIRQEAISAGVSIPILSSRSTSRFNLGLEYGRGGTTVNGLLQEEFVTVQIGFTLTPHFLNPWFVQRRYD